MNVSNETKQAFANTSNPRVIDIYFPGLNLAIDMEHIVQESFSLKESVLESDSIEFVGCVASEMSVQLYGVTQNLKNQLVRVSIKVITGYDQQEQPVYSDSVPLFFGKVDSVEMEANHNKRKIKAYDLLYTAGNIEVAPWYNSLNFNAHGGKGLTLKEIRDSLFEYLNTKMISICGRGIKQISISLPNDGIYIKKQYKPKTLRSIDVIKSICQINGVFGVINREETLDYATLKGRFEYRILTDITNEPAYPGSATFTPLLPGATGSGESRFPETYVPYYREIDYQEYTVKPVDKVTIRESEDKEGVSYGTGENNYIIQGNIFAYKLSKQTLTKVARNIYTNIKNIVYRPYESENDGVPWVECGLDVVSYMQYDYEQSAAQHTDVYTKHNYYVFNRTLSGIQALKDSYSATGEQDQRQFITDINARIDGLKKDLSDYYTKEEIEENYYDQDTIDDMFEQIEEHGWSVESVPEGELPPVGQDQVLYLIQGEVVVE